MANCIYREERNNLIAYTFLYLLSYHLIDLFPAFRGVFCSFIIIKSCDRPTRLPLFASVVSLALEFGSHEYVLERFSSSVWMGGSLYISLSKG